MKKLAAFGMKKLITTAILIMVLVGGFLVFKHFRKPVITNQFISNKLENASDLVSAKMIYNGLLHYDDKKGIMIINKDSFAMTYRAELTAGIDMKKVKIKVSDDKVTVTIPKSKIKNINIDEKSIKFYDQSFALFKANQKQSLLDAISKAKEDVQKKGDVKSLLKRADQQTAVIFKGMLEDNIQDRKLVIQQK